MSVPINDGGAAFPHSSQPLGAQGNPIGGEHTEWGMTLRDYFAGQALQGILSKAINPNSHGNGSVNWASTHAPGPTRAAISAYEYADAMLAARKEASK